MKRCRTTRTEEKARLAEKERARCAAESKEQSY